jgi:DNA-binding NtrC family response regulator
MSRPRILVVDDERNMCRTLEILLGDDGRFDVQTAGSAEEALTKLDERTDLVITDLSMPGMNGLQLLRRTKALSADIQVVLMTAYSTVQSALEAMKAGAFEYLIKPFETDELLVIVDRALEQNRLRRQSPAASGQLHSKDGFGQILGRSEVMRRVFHLCERASQSDGTVLITGESGTGKELVARAIHFQGTRAQGPFVAVNCAAVPETLLESEFFGHEKGAFTGAVRTKVGRFEQAHLGTVFLDEVGEMGVSLQAKFLRALEERAFRRVGGVATIKADFRVIAATNRDLSKEIKEGRFREDLFYRLNVIGIPLPPLRERGDDVGLLIDAILAEKSRQVGGRHPGPTQLSDEARAALLAHPYPGNVRELENILERAVILAHGPTIELSDLPIGPRAPEPPRLETLIGPQLKNGLAELGRVTKELERQLIARAVAELPDAPNEEIARYLGTSRRVLELRLQEFGIQKPRGRS